MNIFPVAKVQTLAECKLGQLVRSLEHGEADRLGVVFDAQDQEEAVRGIVTISEDVPEFEVEPQPDQMSVLSYFGNIVWDVDHKGPLETNARNLFDKPGAIISDKDGWFLNVVSAGGFGISHRRMQLNLSTGVLERYRERLNKVAIFGAWEVYLEEQDRRHESRFEIVKFNIKSET